MTHVVPIHEIDRLVFTRTDEQMRVVPGLVWQQQGTDGTEVEVVLIKNSLVEGGEVVGDRRPASTKRHLQNAIAEIRPASIAVEEAVSGFKEDVAASVRRGTRAALPDRSIGRVGLSAKCSK